MSAIANLDTAGALALNRARNELIRDGVAASFEDARPEHQILIKETAIEIVPPPRAKPTNLFVDLLADLGSSVVNALREYYRGIGFLGEFITAIGHILLRPDLFRGTSLVYQIEMFGFRSIPIIALINLAVGAIVAQQGIFQLARFGATIYSVDLIGILVLRELGVLLTSIMIAGRSGSAITAEIGSMKMREEIDALRVMGLSPIEVLVVPRVLALMVAVPLLTFIADMSALFGGLLVCLGLWRHQPNVISGPVERRDRREHFPGWTDQGPFHGADDRPHLDGRRTGDVRVRRIAGTAGDRRGREKHFHGHHSRWAVRDVFRGDPLLASREP